MGDDRKAEYEMAPTEDPENPATPPEKTGLQNGDADDSSDQEWSGLGKEELLRVADTPAWNWTRNILLVLFWIAWIIMLIVAIVLVVKAPSCPQVEWYQKSSIYQAFVPSFKDGDNDGTGDLIGLRSQVAKIKEDFGAETIVLSSIFKQASGEDQPFNYLGRETVDFQDIDPKYGTLADFDKLVQEVQVNGMHIIIEFVPNQSSNKHMWFVESSKSKNGNYSDYYTWAEGQGDSEPPNEWKNYKGESAWTYVEARDQWYYHFYESESPDLNFKNEEVVKAIQDAMTFWLDEMKADGFVLVDADRLVEPPPVVVPGRRKRQADASPAPAEVTEFGTDAPDMSTVEPNPQSAPEPTGGDGMTDGEGADMGQPPAKYVQYDMSSSELSKDLEKLLESLYQVLADNSYLGKYRVFIPQHNGPLEQNVFFQREEWRGYASNLHFANSFGSDLDVHSIFNQLKNLQDAKVREGKEDLWNSWMLGHAGVERFASRTGDNARALMMLLYTLPGTPLPFYGDELGLKDRSSGDYPQLMPYPWDGSANGGFGSDNSTVEPWVPYADDLEKVNAEAQAEEEGSFLQYTQKLSMYHAEPSIMAGAFNSTAVSDKTLAYIRTFPEWPAYLVVINVAGEKMTGYQAYESEEGEIVVSASGERVGDMVAPNNLDIGPNDAYLIQLMA